MSFVGEAFCRLGFESGRCQEELLNPFPPRLPGSRSDPPDPFSTPLSKRSPVTGLPKNVLSVRGNEIVPFVLVEPFGVDFAYEVGAQRELPGESHRLSESSGCPHNLPAGIDADASHLLIMRVMVGATRRMSRG